ncbi:hypothetical protein LAD77_02150 [Klebsiella pneumoniae]|nr:hypothetical protein [Klebsiella pneumoniae]
MVDNLREGRARQSPGEGSASFASSGHTATSTLCATRRAPMGLFAPQQ